MEEHFTDTNKYDTDLNCTDTVMTHAEVVVKSTFVFSGLTESMRGCSLSGSSVQNSKSVWWYTRYLNN